MKNKLLNFFLITFFIIFFVHLLKDITQDILKISTPLDYIGDLKEILSSFSLSTQIIYYAFGVLSVIAELFLVIAIPIYLFKKKKNLLISIYLITIFLVTYFITVYSFFIFNPSNFYLSTPNKEIINYSIDNTKYKLLVADTPKEWQKGLMFYKNKNELKGSDGMIFIFPEKQVRTFWNKNTYMDLDIFWMNEEKIIGQSFLPSIAKSKQIVTVSSPEPANKVIEIIIKN